GQVLIRLRREDADAISRCRTDFDNPRLIRIVRWWLRDDWSPCPRSARSVGALASANAVGAVRDGHAPVGIDQQRCGPDLEIVHLAQVCEQDIRRRAAIVTGLR